MSRQARFHIGYWVAAILGVLVLQYFYAMAQKIEAIPYSQFEQLLHDGKVAEIGISDRYIQGRLKQPLPSGKSQCLKKANPKSTSSCMIWSVRSLEGRAGRRYRPTATGSFSAFAASSRDILRIRILALPKSPLWDRFQLDSLRYGICGAAPLGAIAAGGLAWLSHSN